MLGVPWYELLCTYVMVGRQRDRHAMDMVSIYIYDEPQLRDCGSCIMLYMSVYCASRS